MPTNKNFLANMRVFYGLDQLDNFKNPVITIGTFDGVHCGHQAIFRRIRHKAEEVDGVSIIITFEPHPRMVLVQDGNPVSLLTTLEEKINLLEKNGIDNLVVMPFTKEFAALTADAYISDFLVAHFHPHTIVIGYDHHFGINRSGNIHLLEKRKDVFQYEIEEISAHEINNSNVSSTRIRQAIAQGNIQLANDFLGYDYSVQGKVIEGDQRGRTIGFPTANIALENQAKLIPATGVYAVQVFVEDKEYNGMLNIGTRPTIEDSSKISIEVHLLDFQEMIYGKIIRIAFISRLRDEKKFDSLDALVLQLQEDKKMVEAMMKRS